MDKQRLITFDAFTLDTVNESLWRGSERIHLRPKTFAFLRYLAARPGQMITKEHLLNDLWKDFYVGDGALKTCVAEIRKQLGDVAETPRIIETEHRRGYRFIAKTGGGRLGDGTPSASHGPQDQGTYLDSSRLVGRTRELEQLQSLLEGAIQGVRQVVFVSGEQGIGKTALVDEFLRLIGSESQVRDKDFWIARGQCIKTLGAGEAYMPFREAFTDLCYKADRNRVVTVLRQYAPLWLLQMPSLINAGQLRKLRSATQGVTRERILIEMAEALEALTTEMPLILVLEDLHWSDYSTLDLISYLAQRRVPARLLLIATYRPTETLADDNPLRTLKNDLIAHKQCHELPLGCLSEGAVGEYLMQRFTGHSFRAGTAAWIHRWTEGYPLFMVNVLDHLVARGFIAQQDRSWTLNLSLDRAELEVPQTIQEIIERQIERCTSPQRRLIEAASVIGMEFSISAIAAVLDGKAGQIEKRCRELVQHRLFIEPAEPRPIADGLRESYKFSHVVYQSILYQRLSEDLRADLHRRVAEYIERTQKKRLSDVAAGLAIHFEQGRRYRRAIQYYQQAASNANWKYAGREAMELAKRGLHLLEATPSFPEKPSIEISLQVTLGNGLLVARGFAATEEVKHAFHRATELFQQLSKRRWSCKNGLQFYVLWDLWYYNWRRAEYAAASELAEQMMQLAGEGKDSIGLAQAHYAVGRIMLNHGKFSGALKHLEQCPTIASRIYAALTMWNLGFPSHAMKCAEETIAQAVAEKNLEGCILAYMGAARIHVVRREGEKALDRAQAALDISCQHNLIELWLNPTKIMSGWALAKFGRMNEGIEQVRQALADEYRGLGVTHITSFLLTMFAEILGDAGKVDEALIVIQQALDASRSKGVNSHDAEIYRLKGELLMQEITSKGRSGKDTRMISEAESCFKKAVQIARQQQARSFELRAASSLARLLQRRDRVSEARELLKKAYGWFTEGHDTADLQDARELIRQLS